MEKILRAARLVFPRRLRKILGRVGWFVLVGASALGNSADDIAVNTQLRLQAIQLLRQGRTAETKQKLGATVSANNAARDLDVGAQWISMAFHFFARGERALARQAAGEALLVAAAALKEKNPDAQRAGFLCNAGLLSEKILHDTATAQACYAGALVAQPNNEQAKHRQDAAAKLKKAPGKAGG